MHPGDNLYIDSILTVELDWKWTTTATTLDWLNRLESKNSSIVKILFYFFITKIELIN